jgi:ergothioneine biosynthesis protein EgtB
MSSTRNAMQQTSLAARYLSVRQATEQLAEPLSAEDCVVQSMPDASPVKWHLAHTSWFFETFLLGPKLEGYKPFHSSFKYLFNSYYNGVGEQYTRADRGLLTRPSLADVRSYRQYVDEHMVGFLESSGDEAAEVVEIGLNHEQQHQELVLTDVKHLLSINPTHPAYAELSVAPDAPPAPFEWRRYDEGIAWIGHDGDGFCFDNELPRHRQFVESFEIGSRLVTNGEFIAFIEDDGYRKPEVWLSEGWATVRANGWEAPLYWQRRDGGRWSAMTLGGLRDVRADEPVCHVSLFEADAFARWSGARLPTEFEWEVAAANLPVAGNFVESGLLHPAPAGQSPDEPGQFFGDVWEWTGSGYLPYPGFAAAEGAIGEYNGKFMCNQFVLRGGSCATPASHARASYRNFFPPSARWQFTGIRLARGCAGGSPA